MRDKQPQRIELPATALELEQGGVIRITFKKNGSSTLIDAARLDRWALAKLRDEMKYPSNTD